MNEDSVKKAKKNRRRITRTAITRKDLVPGFVEENQKEKDIFDIVSSRKRNIEKREDVAKNREHEIALEKERQKDPIYRETCRAATIRLEKKVARRARILENRLSIIKKLTFETMRCPRCKKTKTNLRSWIISKDKTKILCRSCFCSYGWNYEKLSTINFSNIKLFENEIRRYKLNPLSLCRMRQNLNLSITQFTDMAGWTNVYQYKLEDGTWNTISEKTMKEIQQIFSRKGFHIELNIWGNPIIYFVIEGHLIRSIRKFLNLSMVEFADKAKWTALHQHKIETNKLMKITEAEAKTIQSIIAQ